MRYFATSVDGVKATGMCIVLLFQADSKALHVPGGGLVTEPQVGERPEAAAASPTGSSASGALAALSAPSHPNQQRKISSFSRRYIYVHCEVSPVSWAQM